VHLGPNANNAKVYANGGNAIGVDGASGVTVNADDNGTDVATLVNLQQAAGATVNAGASTKITLKENTAQTNTVNIDWNGDAQFAGAIDVQAGDASVTTVITEATSAGTLVVNAIDGCAKLQMGGSSTSGASQATQVHVGTQMDNLWVIADQSNALFLDLYFNDPAAGATVTDLQNLTAGLEMHQSTDATTGMNTFSGSWQHGDSATQLSLSFADASKVKFHLESGVTQTLTQVMA
jgi:hypothetical protein